MIARAFCLVATLLMVAIACCSAIAQELESAAVINREYAIKAAFLYHFSTFVTWPEHVFPADGKPFVIGIYGPSPFGGALTKIALRKKVRGQAIEVRQVTSVQEAMACQILFVPESVSLHQQNAILKATIGLPILTVGDSDGFVERGGSVQFFLEGNKVRFAFGEKSHQRDDLRISSKLLSLAKMIPGP